MTTTAELTEKKEGIHKKPKESFWTCRHFFHNLLTNVLVTVVLLGLIVSLLPHFSSRVEKFIFPSVGQIEMLKKEITVLTIKIDELGRQTQSQKEQLSEVGNLKSQIATFGETLNTYSKSLVELTERFEKFKHSTPQGQMNFLKDGLNQLQQRIDKGETFSDILHGLISKVGSDKLAIDTIHQLTAYANAPTKTSSVLAQELQTICDHLKVRKEENKPETVENKGIWDRFLSKIYGLVHIKRAGEEEKRQEVSKQDLDNIFAKAEEIIKKLNQQDLPHAIESARILAGQYKGLFSSWLQEAETRKSLEEAFSLFKKKIEPLINRSA
ncbi:MAG: hypothetical protein K2Q34_00845 [Alphaproteobacteria bacterium]|nr:hypothetical protein [Alphaproteobacteria bacterium]